MFCEEATLTRLLRFGGHDAVERGGAGLFICVQEKLN